MASRFPNHFFDAIQGDMTSLAGIVQGGQALAYSLANLDAHFQNTFTGYGTNRTCTSPGTGTGRRPRWIRLRHAESGRASGPAAVSEQAVFRRFVTSSATERRGSGAAGDADIAEQQTQQLMKLRQFMLADLSSKQAYQAALLQQDAANKAATEQFFTNSGGFERWPDL